MGVLPLQYPNGESTEPLRLTGEEPITITGIQALNEGTPGTARTSRPSAPSSTRSCASNSRAEAASDRYSGILRQLLDQDISS